MQKIYITFFVFSLLGCQRNDIGPDTNVLEGAYKTNAFIDPLCIAITNDNQLPSLQIDRQKDGSYQLIRTNFIPQKSTETLEGVKAEASPTGFLLYYQQKQIGSYVEGKWYDDKKDKEVTSKVLRVSYSDQNQGLFFYYAGVKK